MATVLAVCTETVKPVNLVQCPDLLQYIIVHFESPEVQASRQLTDGGQREEELFSTAQRNVRVSQLCFLNLLLLLFCGDHRQDFLDRRNRAIYIFEALFFSTFF